MATSNGWPAWLPDVAALKSSAASRPPAVNDALVTARSGAVNPSALSLPSIPPRPKASSQCCREGGATQRAKAAAEGACVDLERGVLAILGGGELQIEFDAAAELLTDPCLQRTEVVHLAGKLTAHQ